MYMYENLNMHIGEINGKNVAIQAFCIAIIKYLFIFKICVLMPVCVAQMFKPQICL